MMQIRMRVGVAAFLLMTVVLTGGGAGARPASVRPIDVETEDCTQIPPDEVPPPALSTDDDLPLEVRVLVEPEDLGVAKEHMKLTREMFHRIGIDLKVRFQKVVAPSAWSSDLFGGPAQRDILEFMKSVFGGQRPAGVDIVYFMTRDWAGGFADCIGGVRFADRAFAFGSVDYALEGIVPVPTASEGVIAAHEIGHLLGAHHHYSNCAEAQPWGATRGDVNPCTAMSPFAATASSTFGVLERSFIRAYTAEYAKG